MPQVGGWYSTSWAYRWPIAIDVSTAGATSDVTITIPTDFDLFWNNVQSDGDDIRITTADGITLATYDIAAGFNTTTRSGTIEIDNLDTTVGSTRGASIQLVWLYFGNAAATSGVSAFAPAAAISGYITLEAPQPAYSVVCKPEVYGATRPQQRLALLFATDIKHDIYFNLSQASAQRSRPYNSSSGLEAPEGVLLTLINESSGATVASAVIESSCRFLYTATGELYCRMRVDTAGTLASGTDYVGILKYFSSINTAKIQAYGVLLDVHNLYS